jgi:hypothetical protein
MARTLAQLQAACAELRARVEANSISPDDVFGISADICTLIADIESSLGGGDATTVTYTEGSTTQGGGSVADALSGLLTDLQALQAEVWPLVVAYGTKNDGKYEYGTSVAPSVAWTVKRHGQSVAPSSAAATTTLSGTMAANKLSYSAAAAALTAEQSFSVAVSQGGQTVNLAQVKWTPTFYRYRGEVSSVPSNYATAIKDLATKELSTVATLGGTNLPANKYYLFAVKSDTAVTLVVRENSTNAIVSGTVTGSVSLTQENNYQEGGSARTNTYYYVLVPASTSAWTFKITNS